MKGAEKIILPLSNLVEWDKNPREIDDAGKARLRESLMLGQYKPLLITEDNGFTVILGGNMRVRVMRELAAEGHKKFEKVWVEPIDFVKEGKKWYAFSHGEKLGLDETTGEYRGFKTKEEGMFVISTSDNARDGYYVEDQLVAQAREIGIDTDYLNMLHVDTAYTSGLDQILARYDMADVRAGGGGKETADRRKVDEQKERYANATIKQIVLYYPTKEYEDMLAFLQSVMDEQGIESNT